MAETVDLLERAPASAPVAAQNERSRAGASKAVATRSVKTKSAAIKSVKTKAATPKAAKVKKPTRVRLDPAVRSELILDEALRQFAERHYSVVTVRDIAVGCGVNPALIYHYFASKDHLFRGALRHALEQMLSEYDARRPDAVDPLAEIMAWLDTSAALVPTLSRMVKIMADYAASNVRDAPTDAIIRRFYAEEIDLFERSIARGVETGRFRPVNVAMMARTISLHLDGIFHASARRGDDRIVEDVDDLRLLIALLLDPRPNPTEPPA